MILSDKQRIVLANLFNGLTFNDGDYDTCETALEIAYYMLDEIQANDDNTTLIKRQLDQWTERINSMKGI